MLTNDRLGSPTDVVEIGSEQLATGGVYRVKPLGAYAMIDDGELDWKVVCICADDPLAPLLHDIEDVERCALGRIAFRKFHVPDLVASLKSMERCGDR